MSSDESVEDFIKRGGVIEKCDPEPDPPVIIRPRYGSAQKKHFMEGDKSFSHGRKKRGAVRYGRCS